MISGDILAIDYLSKDIESIKEIWDEPAFSPWHQFKKEFIEEHGMLKPRFETMLLNKCFRSAYLTGVFQAIRFMETHMLPLVPQINSETPIDELEAIFSERKEMGNESKRTDD